MRRVISHLIACKSGVAAAEMALITPILLVLMFGSFELGHYFWNQHVVVKSTREAARYAARLPFSKFSCTNASIINGSGANPTSTDTVTIDRIKLLARTGQITSTTAAPVVRNWTSNVSVTVSCPTADFSTGLYDNLPNAPRVTVAVTDLVYPSLFGTLGFGTTGLKLNASSQAAVMGL
jgi:Flp pilus assembly protein TadG